MGREVRLTRVPAVGTGLILAIGACQPFPLLAEPADPPASGTPTTVSLKQPPAELALQSFGAAPANRE